MRENVPSARYSPVCNVLRQWRIWLIRTYRVYRLYDYLIFIINSLPEVLVNLIIILQWNLRITDNLGPGILSVVRRLVSLGGQLIFSLKMP